MLDINEHIAEISAKGSALIKFYGFVRMQNPKLRKIATLKQSSLYTDFFMLPHREFWISAPQIAGYFTINPMISLQNIIAIFYYSTSLGSFKY